MGLPPLSWRLWREVDAVAQHGATSSLEREIGLATSAERHTVNQPIECVPLSFLD